MIVRDPQETQAKLKAVASEFERDRQGVFTLRIFVIVVMPFVIGC
jgi:hypothetical protein